MTAPLVIRSHVIEAVCDADVAAECRPSRFAYQPDDVQLTPDGRFLLSLSGHWVEVQPVEDDAL